VTCRLALPRLAAYPAPCHFIAAEVLAGQINDALQKRRELVISLTDRWWQAGLRGRQQTGPAVHKPKADLRAGVIKRLRDGDDCDSSARNPLANVLPGSLDLLPRRWKSPNPVSQPPYPSSIQHRYPSDILPCSYNHSPACAITDQP
jgi:hypothetical protein